MSWEFIDVSSNNHPRGMPIDWHGVAEANYRGVMIKATEGLDYVNPWLRTDAEGARDAGLHVGYYHYARPVMGGGIAQAQFAIDAIKELPRDLGLALDLEVTGGLDLIALDGFGEQFVNAVAEQTIGSPVYMDVDYVQMLPRAPWGHKLWLASWGRAPRGNVWAWQSGSRDVPGILGTTDVNTFYG